MTTKHFNAVFRPLVEKAWQSHCRMTGQAHSSRSAKDVWYRDQVAAATGGRIRSTSSASDQDRRRLIDRMTTLSQAGDQPRIDGWTDGQNDWFAQLERRAWASSRSNDDHIVWLTRILEDAGIFGRRSPDKVKSFESVMANLAVVAGDMRAIDHFSQASEIRMRWQIQRLLNRLSDITGIEHTWEYILGVWEHAHLLPVDINDAPAATLWKILQMLDTHVRREQRRHDAGPDSHLHPTDTPVSVAVHAA